MLKIPLHLPQLPHEADALDRLVLWSNMQAVNPKGFRDVSLKKNRKRVPTRVQKLADMLT